MKNTLIMSLVVLGFAMLTATTGWAYPVAVGDRVRMYDGDTVSTPWEGHYQADNLADAAGTFGVFCLEKNEYFYPAPTYNAVYRVESVLEYAKNGGISGFDALVGGDPLSYATKWIFSHFMQKDLVSVVGLTNSYNLDAEIQAAIWKLEGEITSISGDALTIYNKALLASGPLAYDVKVMNLVYAEAFNGYKVGDFAQSQLIAQPVPEPSTMVLFGAGLAGLALARRRFTKKAS